MMRSNVSNFSKDKAVNYKQHRRLAISQFYLKKLLILNILMYFFQVILTMQRNNQQIDMIDFAYCWGLVETDQHSLQQRLCDFATLQVADESSRQVSPILRPNTKGSHLMLILQQLRRTNIFSLFTDGLLRTATDVCLNAYACLIMIDVLEFSRSRQVVPIEWWNDKSINGRGLKVIEHNHQLQWLSTILAFFKQASI